MYKFEAVLFVKRKIFGFLLLSILLLGCKKEPISWDIDTFFPLMHTRMTLQQVIPDSMLNIGNNQELNLIYKGSLVNFKLDSILSMPDTTVKDEFLLPFGSITLPPGQTFLSDTNFSRYELGGAQLTHLHLQSGSIHLTLSSSLNGASVMEYSLPTATKNGVPFLVKENIPAGTNANPAVIHRVYDLSGYNISLTGINDDDFNVIANAYRAYIDSSGTSVIVNTGDKFTAINSMVGITPNYARGYFGSGVNSIVENNQELDAFKNVSSGSISLDDATIEFNIINETGVDITAKINDITGVNTNNNSSVTLQSWLSNNKVNLNRATELNGINSSPVPSMYKTVLDNTNSNVTDFIGNLPNQMNYDFEINLNPMGNVSNSNDFLYKNTGIEIELDAIIPLKFNMENLVLLDTSEFSIDSTSQKDVGQITGGFINIHTDNWYPFSLETQFYMLDENNVIIDSVFSSPQIIQGANPVFGVVSNPIYSLIKAPINNIKIEHLYQTTQMISKIKMNSTDTGNIQILESYFIDVKIIGDFTYLISIE